MPRTLQNITEDAIQLPRQEQLALARILLELDDCGAAIDVEASWDQEIKVRIKAYDEGHTQAIPYAEFKSKMLS